MVALRKSTCFQSSALFNNCGQMKSKKSALATAANQTTTCQSARTSTMRGGSNSKNNCYIISNSFNDASPLFSGYHNNKQPPTKATKSTLKINRQNSETVVYTSTDHQAGGSSSAQMSSSNVSPLLHHQKSTSKNNKTTSSSA